MIAYGLLGLAACYLAVCALMFAAQTALLFPRHAVRAGPATTGAEPLALALPGGERLAGEWLRPATAPAERLLVLGFPGNGWNASAMTALLHRLYPSADVVVFHYRGYAPSTGNPSARALEEDALRVFDAATARVPHDRVVAVGFSIGTGVAAHLAVHRPLDGLILVTPFDSLTKLVASHYPWLPASLLLRHRMEPAAELSRAQVPVALIVAGQDRLTRPDRARALADALPDLVSLRTIADAGHNDIYGHVAFTSAMREALARTAGT